MNKLSHFSLAKNKFGFELMSNKTGFLHLDEIDRLPFNFYLADEQGILMHMNELNANTMGYDSVHSAIGKNLFDYTSYSSALKTIENNREVILTNKFKIVEEFVERENLFERCLSFKYPLYFNQKIVGIFGCSVYFARDSLTDCISQIVSLGLLSASDTWQIKHEPKECPYHFTLREKECLYYSIRGKTARQIGYILKISPRTVEHHLINIKNKMGVNTRSQMIELGLNSHYLIHN